MYQYIEMAEDVIISRKDGRALRVIDFRKRNRYTDSEKFLRKVQPDEILRLERMAENIFSDITFVEHIVDANDTDMLSIEQAQVMRYPDPALLVGV